MPTKPLERLMFAQGGLCFFCNAVLPKAEASVEHLVASANAGSNLDDNCVACCKSMNTLLGRMSLKEKIKVVLNQKGAFKCPNGVGRAAASVVPAAAKSAPPAPPPTRKAVPDDYSLVLTDLTKRGSAKPRKVETLKNTIRAAVKKPISDSHLDTLIKHLQANGKITINDTKVSYLL
jgi:hypothetical protein